VINHRAYRDNPNAWLGTCMRCVARRPRLTLAGKFWLSYFAALVLLVVACTGCGGGDPEDFAEHDVLTPRVDCSRGACK
jgi:hypothetical protein